MSERAVRLAELREALRLARLLGFSDDVNHWKSEIEKAEREGTS